MSTQKFTVYIYIYLYILYFALLIQFQLKQAEWMDTKNILLNFLKGIYDQK